LEFLNDYVVKGPKPSTLDVDLERHRFPTLLQAYSETAAVDFPLFGPRMLEVYADYLASLNVLVSLGMVRIENPDGTAPNLCSYRITALGLEFVAACRRPKKVDVTEE
jgi:hypothetical protein